MENTTEKYRGKAKTLFQADQAGQLIMQFRDDATAFNAQKHAVFSGKGKANNAINAHIMEYLHRNGIQTHFIRRLDDTSSLVKSLSMLPLECVVRNIAAGSLTKRLGITKGQPLSPSIVEFYWKNDDRGDPLINESHIITFAWANEDEIQQMRALSLEVNDRLSEYFATKGLLLVDFKLEFGRLDGQLCLGDEITPDGCRIWDEATREILDKDRFRQGLGELVEHYHVVAQRLGVSNY